MALAAVVIVGSGSVVARAQEGSGSDGKPAATKPAAAKKAAPATATGANTAATNRATTKPKTAKGRSPAKRPSAAALAAAAAAATEGPNVRDFQAFCDEWMQKLRDRETYNSSHITWETKDGRVSGEYTGYGTDKTCIAREEPGKDPIGKINYRETRYRREGATQAEAMAVPGTIVEQEDVTEIFRYAKGRWQY